MKTEGQGLCVSEEGKPWPALVGEPSTNSSSVKKKKKQKKKLRNHGHDKLPFIEIRSEPVQPSTSGIISPDPKKWCTLMKVEMSCADQSFWSDERKIMLAPKALRDVHPEAYTPELLFIGPLTACSLDTLSPMDRCKALHVNTFLARCPSSHQLEDLTAFLFEADQNPGDAYFNIPDYFDKETLKLVIAVDSVFILEFLCFIDTSLRKPFMNPVTVFQMQRDLFIIGNQVPLSNLKKLAHYQGLPTKTLLKSIHYMIWEWSPFTYERSESHYAHFQMLLVARSLQNCEHLLDCLYQACVRNSSEKQKSLNDGRGEKQVDSIPVEVCEVAVGCGPYRSFVKNTRVKSKPSELGKFPRASELCRIGVKFKPMNGNATAISYDKKNLVVELPKLVVFDGTECMLRNLAAYEQTSKEEEDICAYLSLMDDLIDNTGDLDILYKAGVLQNFLGSDEKLVAMWNEIAVNIQVNNHERLMEMTQDIRSHYDTNWRKIYIEFRHRYFSKPWHLLSTIAALLLVFMTTVQTAYTAMGFYKG